MAFLGKSRVLKSNGEWVRIDSLSVGDGVQTYVSASGTNTDFGDERVNIGSLAASTITSIDSSSLVSDFTDGNSRAGDREHGMYLFSGSNNSWTGSLMTSKTKVYTGKGFLSLDDGPDNINFETPYLNSLESGSYSSNDGWHIVRDISFFAVNDEPFSELSELAKTASLDEDQDIYFRPDTKLYKLTVADNDSYIVGQYIVHQ